ncbi:hypothetical protein PC9H_004951 [Pleurotus ostreatus]|uniref:Uncharacterized protein n=1 Tax=Pleurotus ostreatus TaxID=5322 RepID=A0A8H7A2Y4_PLEOS|nr:uncharacterized protein PC9H_004951 [Pleurotus ostreatus]KAF7433007.1 hypothetical protein PC9H_004951 [Pleurotus ostreatus]
MNKAIEIARNLYKQSNTEAKLHQLDEAKMVGAGVDSKDTRRLVMVALRKAGYAKPRRKSINGNAEAGPSIPTPVEVLTTPVKKRKRKRSAGPENTLLPNGPPDDAALVRALDFGPVLDEQVLMGKSVVVNRAPVMSAWATVVAERMGFKREEALSIASVYTEMNAISKGVALGIFAKSRTNDANPSRNGSQPYVDFIGRRSLYETQNSQWRAILNGSPASPGTAFGYISRSFKHLTPFVLGSLQLLAESYSQKEINEKAWGLYAEFRPTVDGWGQRSVMKCADILALRKLADTTVGRDPDAPADVSLDAVKYSLTSPTEMNDVEPTDGEEAKEPDKKRVREMTLEEYEDMLNRDTTFDNINLDINV